jgi:hypothetical protein
MSEFTIEQRQINNLEESIAEDTYSWVESQIREHFKVENITDLTNEQIENIATYSDKLYETEGFKDAITLQLINSSVSRIIDYWDSECG